MRTRLFSIIVLSFSFVFLPLTGNSINEKKKVHDNHDLEALDIFLRSVSRFEIEASRWERKGNSNRAEALRNYYGRKARLDSSSVARLHEIARNFNEISIVSFP